MYYNYFITHLISWPVPLHKAECSKWHYVHSVRGFSTRPATLRGWGPCYGPGTAASN